MGRPRKKKTAKSSGRRVRGKSGASARKRKPAEKTFPSGPPRKPTKPSARRTGPKDPNRQRLQKVLAGAGYGSRRECENFIVEGRVEVDGNTVTELGTTVNPRSQVIRFDGDVLPRFKPVYYIVNKPTGFISTNNDPSGRMRVVDLVPEGSKLFTVGRLDKASEGLMLVTNDGELANRLAHPRYGVEKIYQVVVAGYPDGEALRTLRRGVYLAEGVVRVERLAVKKKLKNSTQLEMVLTEGRNREIRRMAASIGHKVLSLKRVALGTLRIGTIPPGAYRPLTDPELKRLRALCTGQAKPKSKGKRRPTPGGRSSTGRPTKSKASESKRNRRGKSTGSKRGAAKISGAANKSKAKAKSKSGSKSKLKTKSKLKGKAKAGGKTKAKGRPAKKTVRGVGGKPGSKRKKSGAKKSRR